MPLPNLATGEPAPARNQQPAKTAREKLQDLNAQSKAEMENGLLKQNLTEYTALFEKLRTEQNDFLQQAERSWQQERQRNAEQMKNLQEQVTALTNANEQLNKNMSAAIAAMTSDVKAATVQAVDEGLKANKAALGSAVKKVADYDTSVIKILKEHLANFKNQQKSLFEIDGLRCGIFWAGCLSNFVSLLLLAVVFSGWIN